MTRIWHERTPGERRALSAGGVVLASVLLWVAAWEPLDRKRTMLRQEASDNAAALAWLRPAAAGKAAGTSIAENTSLLARVDAVARAHGVQAQLSSIEPEGAQRVRLQFVGVPFDALARCLAVLAEQGVAVDELAVQRSTGAGRVDARLALRDPRA